LSHALRDLDKIDEALEHAEIAVRLDPTFVTGLHNLGRLLQVSGDRVRAYQMFDRALRLVPDYAPARFSLGMFYLEAGDFARAQTEFALTLKSDPYHSQARLFYDYATKALREASARPQ
jgi:tetratricopeptide (TPR) repeat protein